MLIKSKGDERIRILGKWIKKDTEYKNKNCSVIENYRETVTLIFKDHNTKHNKAIQEGREETSIFIN